MFFFLLLPPHTGFGLSSLAGGRWGVVWECCVQMQGAEEPWVDWVCYIVYFLFSICLSAL